MISADPASEAWLRERIERVERATKSWRWLMVAGLLAIFAGFIVLSIYLNNARVEAEQARDAANELFLERNQRANALANTLLAATALLRGGDQKGAIELLEETSVEQEQAAAAPLPAIAVEQPITAVAPPAAQPMVTSVLAAAAEETPSLILAEFPAAGEHQVYVQFAGNIPRRQIVELNQALRKSGWNMQGASGERIATAAGRNEVRFSSEADREAAEALAAALTQAAVGGSRVQARQLDIIRPGTLEAWISR